MLDAGILYPSFAISNLEISGDNGNAEHIQQQITIQIWGCNVKEWAHYIILNANLAPKDRSISQSSDCGRIWKRRAVVAVERLKRCYILQPLETCRHSNLLAPYHHFCLSLSFSLTLSVLFSLWLCSGSFYPFCFTVTFLITPPLCIHTVYLAMYLSAWLYLYLYVCVHLSVCLNLLHSGPFLPPLVVVCFGCQVVPVWYLRYVLAHASVCAYNSLHLFCFPSLSVRLLYLSAP